VITPSPGAGGSASAGADTARTFAYSASNSACSSAEERFESSLRTVTLALLSLARDSEAMRHEANSRTSLPVVTLQSKFPTVARAT